MDGNWQEITLNALCIEGVIELRTGPFGSQLHASDYVEQGVPVVPTEAIRSRQIDHAVLPHISTEKAMELSRHQLQVGDILFARRGVQATGHIGYVREGEAGFVCGTGAIRLRVGTGQNIIDADFLSHVLSDRASIAWFKFHAIGATMPNLNEGIIKSFALRIPDIEIQRSIARVLGALDDKIELNRKMNKTLEAMARALFQSWFVDFDPVRAKAEGRDPGLPPHLADLFPSSLVDSEMGEIPEGWSVESLDEIAEYVNGLALQRFPAVGDDSLPVIKIAQLRACHSVGADRASPDIDSRYIVDDGDILFSWSGSLLCDFWTGGSGALNQHLFKVIPKNAPRWLCYMGTKHFLPEFQFIAASKATTMGHIQRRHLTEARLAVPAGALSQAMTDTIEPILSQQILKRLESRTLASLRDTLLPKLISGELRVKDAERAAECLV